MFAQPVGEHQGRRVADGEGEGRRPGVIAGLAVFEPGSLEELGGEAGLDPESVGDELLELVAGNEGDIGGEKRCPGGAGADRDHGPSPHPVPAGLGGPGGVSQGLDQARDLHRAVVALADPREPPLAQPRPQLGVGEPGERRRELLGARLARP